jgi:hypothetical protein
MVIDQRDVETLPRSAHVNAEPPIHSEQDAECPGVSRSGPSHTPENPSSAGALKANRL